VGKEKTKDPTQRTQRTEDSEMKYIVLSNLPLLLAIAAILGKTVWGKTVW